MAKDSSDSNEENEGKLTAHNCVHLNKAIHLNAVKKLYVYQRFPRECSRCKTNVGKDLTNGHVEKADEEDCDLYICLRCGNCACSTHAAMHSANKQTEVHDIAVIPDKWTVHCFKCENDLPSDANKQLFECVEYLRKKLSVYSAPKKEEDSTVADDSDVTMTYTGSFVMALLPQNTYEGLPSVRGIANLGNTCFMNATLQCLAQTPFLLPVLEDMRFGGETFRLPGGDVRLGEDTVSLNPLQGTLKGWGPLTAALAETLRALQSGRSSVFVPRQLRGVLEDKCPQFAGYVQHDAHELLRQLLDTVRTEDLKRYQAGILEELHLEKKSDRNSISDRQLLILKGYGRQAGELLLKPCEVFRGELVSTLVCQRCQHATEHMENFLDLSLPVVADKPVHVRRRVNSEDRDLPSKHQLRKEQNAARRRNHRNHSSISKKLSTAENGAGEELVGEEETRTGACDASDEDSDVKIGEHGVHKKMEVGDKSHSLARPVLEPIIARTSPDMIAQGEEGSNETEMGDKSHSPARPVLEPIIARCSPEMTAHDEEGSNKPEAGDKLHTPTRPILGPIISRFSPDMTAHDEEGIELCAPPQLWNKESADEDGQACGPQLQRNRLEETRTCSSESPSAGSDVPNLGSDDNNRINDLDTGENLDVNSNDDSIDQDGGDELLGAIGGSGETGEVGQHRPERADGDVGESGYSSEKPINSNSACVSPSSTLDLSDLRVGTESDQSTSAGAEACAGGTMAPRVYVPTGECTLITCLNQFTAQELLTGNNKVGCEACTERANGKGGKTLYMDASKQLLVSNPPAILILHLKRFQVFGFTSRKNSEEVKFPTVLDLAPFCSVKCKGTPSVRKDQAEVRYSLYGVVQHSGGMHGGHYVAYVKVRPGLSREDPRWSFLPGGPPLQDVGDGPPEPPQGKWYYVSDSNVHDVREPQVLSTEAYLLFYERIW